MSIVDEELWSRLLVQAPLPHVVDNTDDLLWWQVHKTVQMDHPSYGILGAKEQPRQRTIDDDHGRRARVITRLQSPARA